jgi:hypothetical protein
LGFVVAIGKPPKRANKIWVLDGAGVPMQVAFAGPIPRSNHRPFLLTIPWWFITTITIGISVMVCRKTRPQISRVSGLANRSLTTSRGKSTDEAMNLPPSPGISGRGQGCG